MNSKFEILKNHIDKNATIEDREIQNKYQSIASMTIIVLGIYAIISGITDLNQLLTDFGLSKLNIYCSDIFLTLFGVSMIISILYKLKRVSKI